MFMQIPKVMAWCTVARENVVGPYFFVESNVDGEKYRKMPIHYAFPRFENLRQDYIVEQDGAPAHYSSCVRNYLDNRRPNNWMGRSGAVDWASSISRSYSY